MSIEPPLIPAVLRPAKGDSKTRRPRVNIRQPMVTHVPPMGVSRSSTSESGGNRLLCPFALAELTLDILVGIRHCAKDVRPHDDSSPVSAQNGCYPLLQNPRKGHRPSPQQETGPAPSHTQFCTQVRLETRSGSHASHDVFVTGQGDCYPCKFGPFDLHAHKPSLGVLFMTEKFQALKNDRGGNRSGPVEATHPEVGFDKLRPKPRAQRCRIQNLRLPALLGGLRRRVRPELSTSARSTS